MTRVVTSVLNDGSSRLARKPLRAAGIGVGVMLTLRTVRPP